MISISLVTVTQRSRLDFLKILVQCIENQTYKNIIEWVIIDTTGDLKEEIDSFKLDFKIIYHKSEKKTLGAWRNEYNSLVKGDIIVCLDDDEYYPPQRVSHAVEILKSKKFLIAGCDKMLCYDIHYKQIYQYKGFKPYHSTNNCMAYWKEYIENHSYNEAKTFSEEEEFTNFFSEPMAQLIPNKTVLQFSHDENTFNKKIIIYDNFFLPDHLKYIIEQCMTPKQFINNNKIYKQYQEIFKRKLTPKESEYDIVYFCGGKSIKWDPRDEALGGSEQAVKYLSTEWAKMGRKVIVYGNFEFEGVFNDVVYSKYINFKFWDKYKTLILWRIYGMYPYITFPRLNADKIFVDLHDHVQQNYELILKNESKIDYIMVKSVFQKLLMEAYSKHKFDNFKIIPNGIRIDKFEESNLEQRNPFRFCYTSCYMRGLERILKNIWPKIYAEEPKAEFHIYYGMNNCPDSFKKMMEPLLSQPGVFDHGRQPLEVIVKEKHLSTFHFYYSSFEEIDCISIRESLVAGCIPLISDVNIFPQRTGIHIKWLPDNNESNTMIARDIIGLMKSGNMELLREQIKKCATIVNWEYVAKEWLSLL